ncbi:hypothetical protein C8Q77DRAFT_1128744 [Trametes polyzona]|nr:hypothetical protein C8Q77DRAFT_1128744 [Trametes polyzona]
MYKGQCIIFSETTVGLRMPCMYIGHACCPILPLHTASLSTIPFPVHDAADPYCLPSEKSRDHEKLEVSLNHLLNATGPHTRGNL